MELGQRCVGVLEKRIKNARSDLERFSIKTAYKLAVQLRDKECRDASSSSASAMNLPSFDWYKIWQKKLPSKVKMLLWRFAHNSLHAPCKFVQEVWRAKDVEDTRMLLMNCQSGREVLQKIWALDPTLQRRILVLLWRWWEARNKVNAGARRWSMAEHQTREARAMWLVITVATSWTEEGSLVKVSSALQAETLAALAGLERAAVLGMNRVHLETDAVVLGQALSSSVMDLSLYGAIAQDLPDQEEAGEEDAPEPPIPYWIRMRTDNTIRYNAKRRHWRRTKLGF
ncbi:hypothetical protein PR202_ga27842 [Eleusine coracana subsp. coracana]|uniref:Reverse transcriptase zinc-binding domain-containing protein n=1 Tax=Eleusine coracana subsp. coracana TaxID=191504 RepID=A0AAV5DHP9_ELECO|nr:hypothetical protein PR202_ga27842 [Eleusine coracana subsp. coracana]